MTKSKVIQLSSLKILVAVILVSLSISIVLAIATWNINFWPTDVYDYYLDAAVRLPGLQHLSQIHESLDAQNVRWLHGKEIVILCVSLIQRIMGDTTTLRPFIVLSIISFFLISVLLYVIVTRWWGVVPGLVCYLGWVTSFWPYVYILFAKHHLPGMMFFLLAVFSVSTNKGGAADIFRYLLGGLCLGLSLFASPVAGAYVLFFAAFFVWDLRRRGSHFSRLIPRMMLCVAAVVVGVLCVLFYVNWPHVLSKLSGYRDYIHISGSFNHFYYNQPYLQRWFQSLDLTSRPVRGGWLWIVKYFFVIMPVLFPLYLLSGAGALGIAVKKKEAGRFFLIGVFLISLFPVFAAETAGVAQYGGNYFPAFLGILIFLAAACSVIINRGYWAKARNRFPKTSMSVVILLFLAQVGVNGFVYLSDVYPTRMVTTFLSRKIKELKAEKISTYLFHPHRVPFTEFLSPDVVSQISFSPVRFCVQSPDAPVLVPPLTGDSIYVASISTYYDFDRDMFLNQLRENDLWDEFALFSVKTLASSRIWLHEEEILSYRKLIMGHAIPADERLTRAWLLDGEKLNAQKERLIPPPPVLYQQKNRLRRIGDGSGVYAYKGFITQFKEQRELSKIGAFIQKQGSPVDELRAYVYRIDDKEKMWVPAGESFISSPLTAGRIPPLGRVFPVVFQLPSPLPVQPGKYFIQIIRSGDDDPANHYLIVNQPLAFQ